MVIPRRGREYYEYICRKVNAPPPLFSSPVVPDNREVLPDPHQRRVRGEGSKRIANTRLIDDTNYSFLFLIIDRDLQCCPEDDCSKPWLRGTMAASE